MLSGGAVCYLAAGLGPVGPGWAAAMLGTGLTLRTLARGVGPPLVRLNEAVADAFPPLLAAAGVGLLRAVWPSIPFWMLALVSLEAYVPTALWASRIVRGRRDTRHPPLVLLLGFLGLALATNPRSGLWLLLAAGVLPLLARGTAPEPEVPAPLDALLEENRSARERDRAQQLSRTRGELDRKLDEVVVLEEVSLQLGASSTAAECVQAVADRVERLMECHSVALFLERDGLLQPARVHSPYEPQISHAALTGLQEELVVRAWKEARPQVRDEPAGGALFPSEGCAVALPLSEFGVLYVGRAPRFPFSAPEQRLLTIVAGQASVALKSLRHREQQQQALELYQESCRRLEARAEGLSCLVESARVASSSLDQERILEALAESAYRSFPCDSLAIFLAEEGHSTLRRWRGPSATPNPQQPLLDAIATSRLPVCFERLDEARFQPLSEGENSLLAVPMLAESGLVGTLCLGHREAGAFGRNQQDLLSLLACHAAVALDNARHHGDLATALRRLQESETQLVQTSKLAAVGQLAAGVAHELNTPLNSILIAVETATQLVDDAARKRLDVAVREGLKARDIVDKLLYYSRDARQGRTTGDLNRMVRDTLELHGHQLQLDGLRVESDLAEPLPPVRVCVNEIQQVLVNLLLNARDAGPGRVRVSTVSDGARVSLRVEDEGPGVPPEMRERIFEPFFTTKPVGKGTGLGLAVSRQIAESHGGSLTLDSTRPGASFVLSLPALDPGESVLQSE
ncbi:MAG: ATP-binding protein [Candidatus Eremiobacterota bacterium]